MQSLQEKVQSEKGGLDFVLENAKSSCAQINTLDKNLEK